MKNGSDNAREAANVRLAKRLIEKGAQIQIYEPSITIKNELRKYLVADITSFFRHNEVIVANRWSAELESVAAKVICRDIYNEN